MEEEFAINEYEIFNKIKSHRNVIKHNICGYWSCSENFYNRY